MANVETLRLIPLKPAHQTEYSAFLLSSDEQVDRREAKHERESEREEIQSVREEIKSTCQSPGKANSKGESQWEFFAGCVPLAKEYLSCGIPQITTFNNSENKEKPSNPASSKACLESTCEEATLLVPSYSTLCGIPPQWSFDSEDNEKRRVGDNKELLSDAICLSSVLSYFSVAAPVASLPLLPALNPIAELSMPASPLPLRHSSQIPPSCSNLRTPLRMPPSGKKRNATTNENKSTSQSNDDESTEASSILGNSIFSDFASLPSRTDSVIPLVSDIDDESSVASVEDLSTISLDSAAEKLETLVKVEMKEVNERETIGDVPQSAAALIRQSSSLSLGSNRSLSFRRKKIQNRRESDKLPLPIQPRHSANHPENKKLALARELRSIVDEHGRYNIKFANVTTLLAAVYEGEEEYELALQLYREATSIYSTKLGDYDNTTVESKVQIAKLLEKMDELKESIELHFNVLSMRQALYGEGDPRIPDTMSFIANTLKKQGHLIQAIKELKRALKLYRAALGDSHPLVTNTVDEISSLYLDAGNYAKATAILEEVVKLKAGTAGINTIDVANTLHVLANAYESADDRPNELRTLKKCYSVFTAVCGESSNEATGILERLALNYKAQGDTGRSVTAYLALLHLRKKILGNAHPVVAKTYLHLGISLRENGRPEKARKCMKQALSIYVGEGEKINNIGMIAEAMHEMALNSVDTGDLSDALKIFKQELAIRRKIGETENRRIAITLHHLGTIEIRMRNNNKALNFFMEALSIYEKMDDEVGIAFAKTLYCTGIVFEVTRNQERATETFEESIKVFEGHGLSRNEVEEIISDMDKLREANTERSSSRKRFRSSTRK